MSIKKIKTFQDLIDSAGGMVHVAAALDIGQDAVYAWPRGNGIPSKHWAKLMELYQLEPQDLFEINQQIQAENESSRSKKQD